MNRKRFFSEVRLALFGGRLTPRQVAGIDAILDYWEQHYPTADRRWLAYVLATAFHETARQMWPIREFGRGRGKAYGVPDKVTGHAYYGRGISQLTWIDNYRRFSPIVGVDLVANPDAALELQKSVIIHCYGMVEGWFTGKKLADYINADGADYRRARKVVNAMDCAALIAGYARKYDLALRAAEEC